MKSFTFLRGILKFSMALNMIALFLIYLGGTACFVMSLDLLSFAMLIMLGACTVVAMIASIVVTVVSKKIINRFMMFFVVVLIFIHICISIFSIANTNTVGWLEDLRFSGDANYQITDDNKYSYRVDEMVNLLFQYRYLILRFEDVNLGDNWNIKISNNMKYDREERKKDYYNYEFWSKLSKTDAQNLYCLDLIKSLQNEFKLKNVIIDVENKKIVQQK